MKSRIELKWKRHCIYCGQPATGNMEHIFPRHVGYIWPVGITCKKCNSTLGAEVDKYWYEDYWIQVKEGRTVLDENKHDAFMIRTVNGVEQLVEPFTSPDTWRSVTKIAFECLSFLIRDQIFDNTFDEWRDYIRKGKPDLANKKIYRVRHHPGLWGSHHELVFMPKSSTRDSSFVI